MTATIPPVIAAEDLLIQANHLGDLSLTCMADGCLFDPVVEPSPSLGDLLDRARQHVAEAHAAA
jgi:hypothetical protein